MDYKSACICSGHNCLLTSQLDLHITSVWCVCVCVYIYIYIYTHTNTHFIFVYPENLIVILLNSYVDDIYLLICNLILNLALVLGTIFVHKPLISSEPTEAVVPELKAPVSMTPKSPTVHDPDPVPSSSQPYNLHPHDP